MAVKKTPEEDFVNEYTRWLLAHVWCPAQVAGNEVSASPEHLKFWQHARAKGWISKKDGKILATGFRSAAAYLRR